MRLQQLNLSAHQIAENPGSLGNHPKGFSQFLYSFLLLQHEAGLVDPDFEYLDPQFSLLATLKQMLPKLTYFGVRGRVEAIRLTFLATETDFEDERIGMQQFPQLKPTLLFGQLPTLQDDQIGTLYQSKAILRYVSDITGVSGNGPVEHARVDMFIEYIRDVLDETNLCVKNEQALTEEGRGVLFLEKLLPHLRRIEGCIQENGFLVGDGLTVADIWLFDVVANFLGPFNWVETLKFVKLAGLLHYIANRPRVKAYFKSDKFSPVTLPAFPHYKFLTSPEFCVYPEQIIA